MNFNKEKISLNEITPILYTFIYIYLFHTITILIILKAPMTVGIKVICSTCNGNAIYTCSNGVYFYMQSNRLNILHNYVYTWNICVTNDYRDMFPLSSLQSSRVLIHDLQQDV